MKIILLILPLAGAALVASAGEPAKSIAPNVSVTLPDKTDAVSTPAGKPEVADQAPDESVTGKIAHAGAATAKALRSTGQTVVESVNPFAPSIRRAPGRRRR